MVTVKCNFLDSLVQYLVFFVYFVFFFNLFDFSKIFFIKTEKKTNDNLKKITKKKIKTGYDPLSTRICSDFINEIA